MIQSAELPVGRRQPACVLGSSVLVLNRHYLPVHVVSVRRCLVMLYRDLVEVIHVEDNRYLNYNFASWMEMGQFVSSEPELSNGREFVRSAQCSIEVPRVIRLFRYDRVPRQVVKFNRRNLFARDNHQCQFCGKSFGTGQLSLDHVVPRSRGGATTWENVVCSCLRCNSRKGDRTPREANMHLIRQPFTPRQNPMLSLKLDNPRYASWQVFLGKQ